MLYRHIALGLSIFTLQLSGAPDDHDLPDASAIVEVSASFQHDASAPSTKQALGFLVESDGFLLTSYEQISDSNTQRLSDDIQVEIGTGADRLSLAARVIGVEPTLNFAVLKVDHDSTLPAFTLNSERELTTGEPVYAYHLNAQHQLAPIRGTFTQMNQLECYQANMTATMLKTEITLPTDSIGAPILDSQGKVFAMHTAHKEEDFDEELAKTGADPEIHLLPMSLAMNIYSSIKERRSLKSPWTGFSVRALSSEEEAEVFPAAGGRIQCGIGLEHIWEGGPAEALGIRPSDVLVRMSHYPICSVANFQKWLYLYGVDEPVKLYFVRDGKLIQFDYTIEERPVWAKPK